MWQYILLIPIIYLVISLTEYYVHRFWMHKKGIFHKIDSSLFLGHAVKHHKAFSPKRLSEPTQLELEDIPHHISYLWLVGLIFAIPTAILGYFLDCDFLLIGSACLLISSILWGYAWNWLHVRIHTPDYSPKNPILRYLKRYHDVHHIYPNKNYNALCIGFDHLLGTYKWQ